jgi:tripartite-type tricarboxylate transporter receptor subunit TctC
LPALPRLAAAREYPAQPIRLIVGFAVGGASDILARLIGRALSERLGQPVVIENRPGAGTRIATQAVVRAPADGYTLLFMSVSNLINAALFDEQQISFTRDVTPISSILRQPALMLVNPSLPARTVPEFIAYAKAHPGRINYASIGVGSSNHVAGELFKMMTGIDMVHVAYRGGAPALIDLMTGQVQLMFIGPVGSMEYVKVHKLRALAVTSTTAMRDLPNIPPIAEFVPGYEASSWFGIVGPRGLRPDIAGKLEAAIRAVLLDETIKARIAELGGEVQLSSQTEFAEQLSRETERWDQVIRSANIRPN